MKLLYPATPQETYEALLAGFYDPNPCLVFEHKLLYWSRGGDIDFDGDCRAVWRPRRYTEGDELTLVAIGAMVPAVSAAAPRWAARSKSGIRSSCNPRSWADCGLGRKDRPAAGRAGVGRNAGPRRSAGLALDTGVFRSLKECAGYLFRAPDAPIPFAPELEAAYRPGQDKISGAITSILATDRLRKVAEPLPRPA